MMVFVVCLAALAALLTLVKSFPWFFSGPADVARSAGHNLLPVFVHTENERVMEHLNSAAKLGLWLALGASVGAFVLLMAALISSTLERLSG